MPTVWKPADVADLTQNQQRRIRANARHRAEQLRLRVGLRLCLNGLLHRGDLRAQLIESAEIAVQRHAVAGAHRHSRQIAAALDAACGLGRRLQPGLANNRRNLNFLI